jgi:hypothetical protein
MEGLQPYHAFLDDLDAEIASVDPVASERCQGCRGELTVLPLEALAILAGSGPLRRWHRGERSTGDSAHGPGSRSCAFLAPDSSCRIYALRPFACRVEGLPAQRQGPWRARLHRLSDEFRLRYGIPQFPITLADLFRAARTYMAFFGQAVPLTVQVPARTPACP